MLMVVLMENKQKLYLVVNLLTESSLSLQFNEVEEPYDVNVPLAWELGQVGVMPVFTDLESAQKYGGVLAQIIEFEINKPVEPNELGVQEEEDVSD